MNRVRDMRKREPASKWGFVYLLFLGLLVLLWAQAKAALTFREHALAQLVLVFVFCAVVYYRLLREERK